MLTMEEVAYLESVMPKIEARVAVKARAVQLAQCQYRVDGEGYNTLPENCCFIGVLIKPELYSSEFESKLFSELNDIISTAIGAPVPSTGSFIRIMSSLQHIHDSFELEKWDQEFKFWKQRTLHDIENAKLYRQGESNTLDINQ